MHADKVPLTLFYLTTRGSDLHGSCRQAEGHIQLHLRPVPAWKQMLHRGCWHNTSCPSTSAARLWNEVRKGPQLPDSCDAPLSSQQVHTLLSKSSSTNVTHRHYLHPINLSFLKDYLLRSRRNYCFKEIISLRVIFPVKFISVCHTFHLLPRNLLSEVSSVAVPLNTWENMPKLPWKPPFTHPKVTPAPNLRFDPSLQASFQPAPKDREVESP